jgi:hypothetical protein
VGIRMVKFECGILDLREIDLEFGNVRLNVCITTIKNVLDIIS